MYILVCNYFLQELSSGIAGVFWLSYRAPMWSLYTCEIIYLQVSFDLVLLVKSFKFTGRCMIMLGEQFMDWNSQELAIWVAHFERAHMRHTCSNKFWATWLPIQAYGSYMNCFISAAQIARDPNPKFMPISSIKVIPSTGSLTYLLF